MFYLRIDDKGDKLVISYEDYFDYSQAERFFADLQKIAPKLKRGFLLVVDLSSLERMDPSAGVFIEKAMDLLNASGVSKVIRIIPDETKDIGFDIMSAFHYSHNVIMHTFKSLQEAERYSGEKV